MNLIQYATHLDSNEAERTIDSCVDDVDLQFSGPGGSATQGP